MELLARKCVDQTADSLIANLINENRHGEFYYAGQAVSFNRSFASDSLMAIIYPKRVLARRHSFQGGFRTRYNPSLPTAGA